VILTISHLTFGQIKQTPSYSKLITHRLGGRALNQGSPLSLGNHVLARRPSPPNFFKNTAQSAPSPIGGRCGGGGGGGGIWGRLGTTLGFHTTSPSGGDDAAAAAAAAPAAALPLAPPPPLLAITDGEAARTQLAVANFARQAGARTCPLFSSITPSKHPQNKPYMLPYPTKSAYVVLKSGRM